MGNKNNNTNTKGGNNTSPRIDNDQLGENKHEKFAKNDCKTPRTSK